MPRRSVVLAKKQLKWAPFFGQYLVFSRTVFVDRANNRDAVSSLRAAGERLIAEQASLLVFPEGTRSLTPDCTLRSFKKGAFHVAIEAGLPIIPVVFENQWHIFRAGVFNSGKCKIRGESNTMVTSLILTLPSQSYLQFQPRECMKQMPLPSQ